MTSKKFPAIELIDLTKSYGNSRGVKNINLVVPKGSIFGFLGPNGAGKTTTISMLVNLLEPTAGNIKIFGEDVTAKNEGIRHSIGYLSSDMALENSLTGRQQLEFFSKIRGADYSNTYRVLAKRLDADLGRKIKQLSRGNRQKIGLISALMHEPDLLILDEPTSGLDPLIQDQFNEIIKEHQAKGGTTFVSSHVLSEVQALCDRVAFIKDGEIVANDTMEALISSAPYEVSISLKDKKYALALTKLNGISNQSQKQNMVSFSYTGDINYLLKHASEFDISELHIGRSDLDAVFINHYKAGA